MDISRTQIIQASLAIFVLFLLFGGSLLLSWKDGSTDDVAENIPRDPFSILTLEADAVIVWDIKKGIPLFLKNSEAQLPLASLTKVMTALVAIESLSQNDPVTLNSSAIGREGDTGLFVGEKWELQELIDLTLLSSSNDGAYALASALSFFDKEEAPTSFQDKMNATARALGLRQTYFVNESGLDVTNGMSGGYGSVRDFAMLLEYILKEHPQLLEATQYSVQNFTSLDGFNHHVSNTNKIIETLPGIVASKTGFTDLAGGNLAIIFEAGPVYPLIAVVLGSTAEGRFSDIEQLVWASFDYLQN